MSEKRRFLEENGFYLTTPSGNSMRPFIVGGRDLVTVLPLSGEARKYDAVLYCRPDGEHVIHRVVGKKEECYLIRGDNCYYTEQVPLSAVIGVVACVRKKRKERRVSKPAYRMAVWLWCASYPLRLPLAKLKKKASCLLLDAGWRKNK